MHYLSDYQTFQSKQQLNEAIADHLSEHYYELSATDRAVLNTIARYAVKFAGAAHLKVATIANNIAKSEKTVRRAINRLQELRVIRKLVTTRKVTGGQGANIIQVLPFVIRDDQAEVSTREDSVEPVVPSVQPTEIENEPSISFKQNTVINNTYNAPTTPYVRFKQSVEYYVKDAKLTNKLYGIYLAHTSFLRNCHESSELLNCGIEAVLTTFKATKRKVIRNVAGYYNGVLDRVLDGLMYAALFDA
ncbi:helix-turn-helix domain-containing protein [Cytobacillus sp. Sa5YUA1]|uniref:Helix-turn-helix domain-containing protein n=2 Tax=Cytobacillus stercorigallinarum TaxID=2762240 RepID=A0ABR8QVJ5_9BACI|nr:helix-turn-helix domain-containing protein [Cytobacillus stercorigallinarum]